MSLPLPLPLLLAACLVAAATARTPMCKTLTPSKAVKTVHIVGGDDATLGQFPHQALVIADERFTCSGSLISYLSVLTAAHCILGFETYSIRLGGIHRSEDEPTTWTDTSRQAEAHPQYNENGHCNNDIGVIMLGMSSPANSYIKLVALPTYQEAWETFLGHYALVSGWGTTDFGSDCSETLKWAEMLVVGNDMCEHYYEFGVITESNLCANSFSATTCYGDSGAALVVETPDGYKQIGVLSFGPPQCETNIPVAFTRLTYYLQWISSTAGIAI